jgi:glyoxylase-like metal-dependent hydrolase (beta-lactamase superfamily II)
MPDGRRFEVEAVRYGTLRSRRSDLYYRWGSYGEPDGELEMAYWFWLLRDGAETVVVDSGFDPAVGERRGRTCDVRPLEALRERGVDPDQVQTVIVTHLHYDHVGNLGAFPNATVHVPRRELEFWTSPAAQGYQFASHVEPGEIAFLAAAAADGRVRLTEGQAEVVDGVTGLEVGGHSPGQQVLVVRGRDGDVVLASDAVHFYEELEQERPFAVMHDLERMYAAYAVLKRLAEGGATVLAGHDPAASTDKRAVVMSQAERRGGGT